MRSVDITKNSAMSLKKYAICEITKIFGMSLKEISKLEDCKQKCYECGRKFNLQKWGRQNPRKQGPVAVSD